MDSMQLAVQPELTHFMEREIAIAAAPARVWQALTSEVNNWWSHSYSDKSRVVLEARIGGRFCEEFDDLGNGALHGTVIFCQPPARLVFMGTMGMKHACVCRVTFELEPQGEGTLLKNAMEVMGIMEPPVQEGYRNGWAALLGQLKDWVEAGKVSRPA